MSAEPHRSVLAWALVGLAVAWLVAVPLGLGPALLGPDIDPMARASGIALLYLPGLVLLSVGSVFMALPLFRAMPRWRPGRPVHGLPRASEPLAPLAPRLPSAPPTPAAPAAPGAPGAPAALVTSAAPSLVSSSLATSPPAPPSNTPPLIALGPGRSPAYAAFGFACKSPALSVRPGFVALPPASRLLLGRDPGCDLVVGLAEASWHHLEFEVGEGGVLVSDLGSKNGTRLETRSATVALTPNTPTPIAVGDTLHLAEPVALSLTLEALR